MKMLFRKFALAGLVYAGLALAAGAASAGTARTGFAVTLTVASRCSVTTSAGSAAGQHVSNTHDSRSVPYPVTVDTRCLHGGQVDVKVGDPRDPGAPAASVSRSDAVSGQARFKLPSEGAGDASRRHVRQALANLPESAPVVVTVTF